MEVCLTAGFPHDCKLTTRIAASRLEMANLHDWTELSSDLLSLKKTSCLKIICSALAQRCSAISRIFDCRPTTTIDALCVCLYVETRLLYQLLSCAVLDQPSSATIACPVLLRRYSSLMELLRDWKSTTRIVASRLEREIIYD
jgi:hypothetical protein